ncbi:ATP-binding domain-containing protein [Viridibacillus sp. NPDC096237]|uniref:ATP-binding domain-containing protein n=1 Tax=Viridibacillus sp. NPDC096237 TaxID=3390721 RepID=UPI003D00DC4A
MKELIQGGAVHGFQTRNIHSSPYMALYAVYQFDEMIKGKFPLKPTSNEITEELVYCRQVVEMPGYSAKGFEFTTVVLADADERKYPSELDAYLLYTISSRATRKLFILYTDKLATSLQNVNSTLWISDNK